MVQTTPRNLEETNSYLKDYSFENRIRWAHTYSAGKVISLVSGGDSSAIIPHLIRAVNLKEKIPLFFLDTWNYRRTTYEMIGNLVKKERHPLTTITPAEVEMEFENLNEEAIAKRAKATMLEYVLKTTQPNLVISGNMHWETAHRAKQNMLEWDGERYRFYPIHDMTEKIFQEYMAKNNLPRNPDHFDIAKGLNQTGECSLHVYPSS